MFAGGAKRVSIAWAGARGPDNIATPRWIKNGDSEESFEFYGQAGVVTTEHLVIAVGYLFNVEVQIEEPAPAAVEITPETGAATGPSRPPPSPS